MRKKIAKELRRRKQRIQYRLRDINWNEQSKPMYSPDTSIVGCPLVNPASVFEEQTGQVFALSILQEYS